jgi:hypothetical protein
MSLFLTTQSAGKAFIERMTNRDYGIHDFLTFNGPDFTRYPGIHVVDPNDTAKAADPQPA